MPIDLTLFRAPHEGGNVQDIYQWQKVRLLDDNNDKDNDHSSAQQKWNHLQSCVRHIEEWDFQRRHIQTTLNDTRSEFKSLQQSLAPPSSRQRQQRQPPRQTPKQSDKHNKSRPKDNHDTAADTTTADTTTTTADTATKKESIQQQIQHLKTQVIPDLELSLQTITLQIEQTLPWIANIVDYGIHDKLQQQQQQQQQIQIQIQQRQIQIQIQIQRQQETLTTITTTNPPPPHNNHHHDILVMTSAAANTVMDPLYCLGGYETLSCHPTIMGESYKHKNNVHHHSPQPSVVVVLSGIGAELHHALRCTCLSFCRTPSTTTTTKTTKSTTKYQLVQLPESVYIPTSLIHNLWGCRSSSSSSSTLSPSSSSSSSSSMTVSSSALTSFSLLHAKKSYQDRELPLFFVNQTTTTITATATSSPSLLLEHHHNNHNKNDNTTSSLLEDDRPSQLFQESHRTTATASSSWIDQLPSNIQTQQMEIFALTACSMVEAQRVQLQMVQQIMDFHQSLLLLVSSSTKDKDDNENDDNHNQEPQHSKDDTTTKSNNCPPQPLLRTRLESPLNLLPCEASRIVIEGYMPPPLPSPSTTSTTTKINTTPQKKKKKKQPPKHQSSTTTGTYVTLGYVSNFTDYMSRPCKTKCGTSAKGKETEFVYTLHGIMTRLSSTMNWMIVNNTVNVVQQPPIPTLPPPTSTTQGHQPQQQSPKQQQELNSRRAGKTTAPLTQLGVGIPCCSSFSKSSTSLATMLHDWSSSSMDDPTDDREEEEDGAFLFLPFQRRIHYGKNGKVRYEELKSSSKSNNKNDKGPRIIRTRRSNQRRVTATTKSPPIHQTSTKSSSSSNDGTYHSSPTTTTTPANPSSFPIFGHDRMPTKQEIQSEACTNPYNGFLPFH